MQIVSSDIPTYFIAIVAGLSVVAPAVFIYITIKTSRLKVIFDGNDMVGAIAEVVEPTRDGVWVSLKGENWRAICSISLVPRQKVKVVSQEGLLLEVIPINPTDTGV